MDFFHLPDAELKSADDFISHVSSNFSMSKDEWRRKFCDACVGGQVDSVVFKGVLDIFRYDCFSADRFRMKKAKMLFLTKLFEFLIAGDSGIQNLGRKLKEYDYSARCSLVWTINYFAYRCRTCGISPSMSLCSSCFMAGNHVGHDFNKFKSLAGGACDCGDSNVMLPSGYCRYHGPDKVHNRPSPPEELVAPLRSLLPRFLPALLYWFWELCSSTDPTTLTDEVAPALFVLHVLHACGWVTQKMIADVLIDRTVFEQLKIDCENELAYKDYVLSVGTNPGFHLPVCIAKQDLAHRHLLDAFIYCTIKLRFPESLVTFLIGLLAVEEFKEEFVQSYLNHYTRIASTVMISARTRMVTDWSLQMNNRIVHISVQLFSGEGLALRMVRERHLHLLLVHCLLNMCECCRTRLDDHSNMVVNCEGPLIQNNVFWPFVSDLSNLVSHKSIVDVFVTDPEFLNAWTKVLRYMQFMNCFVLKEGDHIEYETMAFYHAFTMEIEISANPMWNIWQHYRHPSERERCLSYANACLSSLANLLGGLGRLVSPTIQPNHPSRSPLSLHLPLMRHASCFLSLSVVQHGMDLRQLLAEYLTPKPFLLWRFMDELANTLLGCHEVIVGYWIRNGQALRQSITHYMQSQFCYSFIDLDIFAFQVCATLLPPAYVLNTLLDPTRLLRGIHFYDELLSLVAPAEPRAMDRKPMALEAWLTNLCWILDLRNNICLTEDELVKKELLCVLSPEPRKRSDLASLIPERCGINGSNKNIDAMLKKVATYSGPSCDEASGSLISGHYYLRPSLWHTDFDPIFYSLRVTSRRETSIAMDKYREHCRQRHGISNPSSLWPPYRTPKPLPPNFLGLDHILHSRHLHFLIFIQLCLYVYGDPLMTEESLGLIIHLLDRALNTPCRRDIKGQKCSVLVRPELMQVDQPEQPTDQYMRAKADDELMECADSLNDMLDDDQISDVLTGPMRTSDYDSDDEHDSALDALMRLVRDEMKDSCNPSTSVSEGPSAFRPTATSKKSFLPRWDPSLFKCPYPPRSSLQDNLGCWLIVEQFPSPHISLAPTVLATQMQRSPNVEPVISVIPSVSSSITDSNSGVLVDNILTLLIKAHARLYWNRVSGSSDAVPKILIGNSFTDPNTLAPTPSGITGPSITDDIVILDQVQVNNFLFNLSHSPEEDEADGVNGKTLPSTSAHPRCTAVLGGHNNAMQVAAVFGSSNNMASGEEEARQSAVRLTRSNLTAENLAKLAPELRYFAAGPPAYLTADEKPPPPKPNTMEPSTLDFTDVCFAELERRQLEEEHRCADFGDGAFWIERLLDKIARISQGNDAAIRLYLTRARRPFDPTVRVLRLQPMDSFSSSTKNDINDEAVGPLAAIIGSVESDASLLKTAVSINDSKASVPPSSPSQTTPTPGAVTATREERKTAALERRHRLMQQMASKQRAFAQAHLKEMELISQPTDQSQAVMDNAEKTYECVICQTSGTVATDDLVLLDMMCESGTSLHIRETPLLPELHSNHQLQASGLSAERLLGPDSSWLVPTRPPDNLAEPMSGLLPSTRSDLPPASSSSQAPTGTVGVSVLSTTFEPDGSTQNPWQQSISPAGALGAMSTATCTAPPCYVEARRWWGLALPTVIGKNLPLLRPGLILQTCGHVVHRECFQRYRSQSATRTRFSGSRTWISCPLCRRDVHHLLPLVSAPRIDKDKLLNSRTPDEHISTLENIWEDLNGAEDETTVQRRTLMSQLLGERFEATILLRSQLECELSVLMSCPSQYSIVSRRCSWREFLSYLRQIYRRSTDVQAVLRSLTSTTVPHLNGSESGLPPVPIFALCQDPADILLTLLPHVWPREDMFLTLVAATFSLAYIRALISALLNTSGLSKASDVSFEAQLTTAEVFASKVSLLIVAEHGQHVLQHLRTIQSVIASEDRDANEVNESVKRQSVLWDAARLPEVGGSVSTVDQTQFELHLVLRMLPFLRLAGLCRARWQSIDDDQKPQDRRSSHLLPTGLPFVNQLSTHLDAPTCSYALLVVLEYLIVPHLCPQQRLLEFSDLCRLLTLDCGDTAVISVPVVAELAASRSGLTVPTTSSPLYTLMDRWFGQFSGPLDSNALTEVSSPTELVRTSGIETVKPVILTNTCRPANRYLVWARNLRATVEIGRQLYSPRLIRTPYCFDVLFNALHLVNCDAVQHRFQENALCLICGRLLCTLCTNLSTVMVEHAYSCEGFAGVVLEVNTSIVYVSLGPNFCDWGSVYLDAYGEEDLELNQWRRSCREHFHTRFAVHILLSHAIRKQRGIWSHWDKPECSFLADTHAKDPVAVLRCHACTYMRASNLSFHIIDTVTLTLRLPSGFCVAYLRFSVTRPLC
ncbi:E3 ubiquitin-protein ligase UBR3 [Clonorchis sinensis]|uniref:E3 ubiquitin-protein ligase n=1 Tax=Clonorchis sinensis TaxID=79923 RepID=G7YTE0_CLOSI|nr:E3 ubiquitin-protein ligase UBR3 [Clonorchis sinensis]